MILFIIFLTMYHSHAENINFDKKINKYILKIKLNEPKLKSYYDNHKHAYPDDSGIDLFVAESTVVPPHAIGYKINLGISLEMTYNNKNIPYFLISRSSMSKTALRLSNSIYLIDAGFRGNLNIFVDNLSSEPVYVIFGDRYVQVCVHDLSSMEVLVVDKLSIGTRNEKGVGSSGKSKL